MDDESYGVVTMVRVQIPRRVPADGCRSGSQYGIYLPVVDRWIKNDPLRQDLLFLVLLVGAVGQVLKGLGGETRLTWSEGTGTVIGVDFRVDKTFGSDVAGEVFTGTTFLDHELLGKVTILADHWVFSFLVRSLRG